MQSSSISALPTDAPIVIQVCRRGRDWRSVQISGRFSRRLPEPHGLARDWVAALSETGMSISSVFDLWAP